MKELGRRLRPDRAAFRFTRYLTPIACAALLSACVGHIGEADGEATNGKTEEALCSEPSAGASPLRRMTAEEYRNTVRHLLDVDVASELPSDEKLGAFYANSQTFMSELDVDRYKEAAETLAKAALQKLDTLVPCDLTASGEEACARQFIETIGRRAYRRPLTDAEQSAYFQGPFTVGQKGGGFPGGVRLVIQTMLQSPHFLYHIEVVPPGDQSAALVPVVSYELASRLSYALWASMPDDELLAAAEKGELDTAEGLRAQAERMLDDPRAKGGVASFVVQWLKLDRFDHLEKDGDLYPEFTPALRDAMLAETIAFADWVLRKGDGTLGTLLSAPYSVLDGPMFDFYGVPKPADHDPSEPVDLDPDQRFGILTHASVLSRYAHAHQTSPMLRGILIRDALLCQPLPPPPPEVNATPPEPDPNATLRERLKEHRENPTCASCHNLTDPVGFAFEHYDPIGRFRATEGDLPIDATGELINADVAGTFDGVKELATKLVSSEQVSRCIANQWFRFALGRIEKKEDTCSMEHIEEVFLGSGQSLRELVFTIATSDAFRYRQVSQ